MTAALPSFPVDDATLDLLWTALHPGPDAERTSVGDLLTLYSQMAGSDTEAVAEERDGIQTMRDPEYHHNDVLAALITEVRSLRGKVQQIRALHEPNLYGGRGCGLCHIANESCGCCGSWDDNDAWPCKTVEILEASGAPQ